MICGGLATSEYAQPGQPMTPPPPPQPEETEYPPPAPAPAPVPVATPYAVPVAPPPAATDIDKGVYRDANIGRAWLSPTAMTPPKGTWTFADYELFFLGGSYAFTDKFQISANTMVPIDPDQPIILLSTAKLQIAKVDRLRVALHGSLNYLGESTDSDDDVNFTSGTIGGVVSLCLDRDCDSLLNGYLAAGFGSESDGSVVPFILSGSLVKKMSRRVKFVAEIDSVVVLGEVDDMDNVYLGWYGLRFTSKNIGVDVGFARPFGDVDWDIFPLGFPVLTFTYRDGL